jgi:hypothetical protein
VNCGSICCSSHQPVEDVQFPNQVPFADSADRWIARHLPNIISPERDEPNASATAGSRRSSFDTRVTATDD